MHSFDVRNLRLLPPFNERDPDSFFVAFERVATARGWPNADCALMLQCVLTGKTQEAYSSLSLEDGSSYVKVKSAVLKAYERVPAAYRQRFSLWERRNGQTYVEFARDISNNFKRWLSALDVTTLCDLVIFQQFKNMLPRWIATYISERRITTAAGAAVSADEYVLIHKGSFKERAVDRDDAGRRGYGSGVASSDQACAVRTSSLKSDFKSRVKLDCRESGHWKVDCPVLQAKNKGGRSYVKSMAAASSAGRSGGPFSLCEPDVLEAYIPFIRDGFVSLVGSDVKVPIKILRDTGAYDSYDSIARGRGAFNFGQRFGW